MGLQAVLQANKK